MNLLDRFYFEVMRRTIGTPHWARWLAAVALLNAQRAVITLSTGLIFSAQALVNLNTRIAAKLEKLKD